MDCIYYLGMENFKIKLFFFEDVCVGLIILFLKNLSYRGIKDELK